MVDWYSFDFITRDAFSVVARRTKKGRKCSVSEPRNWMGPLTLKGEDNMTVAMKRIKRGTDCTAAKKRRR